MLRMGSGEERSIVLDEQTNKSLMCYIYVCLEHDDYDKGKTLFFHWTESKEMPNISENKHITTNKTKKHCLQRSHAEANESECTWQFTETIEFSVFVIIGPSSGSKLSLHPIHLRSLTTSRLMVK